jgi:hypothetical protein
MTMEEDTKVEATPTPKKIVRRRAPRKTGNRVRNPQAAATTDSPSRHDVTEPWKRSSLLNAPKIAGYVVRWINTRKEGREEQVIDEGWQYVSKSEVKSQLPPTMNDGTSVDSKVRRRELVLMKLPLHRKAARDKYISDRTMTPEKMAVQLENDMTSVSGGKGHSIFKVASEGG